MPIPLKHEGHYHWNFRSSSGLINETVSGPRQYHFRGFGARTDTFKVSFIRTSVLNIRMCLIFLVNFSFFVKVACLSVLPKFAFICCMIY